MLTSQKFGGNWTEEKLNIFTDYLNAYLIALQNQKFKKIYIDAFAGTGEIETSDGGQYLVGSAKRALACDKKFDHYYFIEADPQKAEELQNLINSEFPQMRRIVTIFCGDANDELAKHYGLEEIIKSVQCKDYGELVTMLYRIADITGNYDEIEKIVETLDEIDSGREY